MKWITRSPFPVLLGWMFPCFSSGSFMPLSYYFIRMLQLGFVAKPRDNALIIGIICHGISSPKAWESFKAWDGFKHNSKLVSVDFRDKTKERYKKCYCRYGYALGELSYLPSFLQADGVRDCLQFGNKEQLRPL